MLLRIRFDDPGWFANSPKLIVTCNGTAVYDGNFRGGFVASIDVGAGKQTIETEVIITPGLSRRKAYTVEMPADAYREHRTGLEARLVYSRLWGDFTDRLELRRIDGERS